MGHRDHKVWKDPRVLKDRMDLRVLRVIRVGKARKDHRVHRDRRVLLGLMDSRGGRVRMVLRDLGD
jgi:hypothetical protein